MRCFSLDGDKARAERVALRLQAEIDAAEDKSAKPTFQEAMDRIIKEELSAMPEEEYCHRFTSVFAIVIVIYIAIVFRLHIT